jgi:hypothetical protein
MIDELTLDANAVAGDLELLFGAEMTVVVARCAHCGNEAAVGTLRAYIHGPGVVLRCTVCGQVVVCWAWTPTGPRIDRSGVARMGTE